MTTCVFSLKDNVLTTVSGADAGEYPILDNYADVLISETAYHVKPFDLSISKIKDQTITMEIT